MIIPCSNVDWIDFFNDDCDSFSSVPDTVKNLTVRLTDDDLLIHWNGLDGIVSHYIVTVYQGVAVLIQSSVTQEFLIILLERYETLQINVSAANDAGVGQPAVTFFEQSNQSGKENFPQETSSSAYFE